MKTKTKRQKKPTSLSSCQPLTLAELDLLYKPLFAPDEQVLRVSISKRMLADLRILARSGLYGLTVQDAARRILEQWLLENPVIAWREPARA